MSTLDGSAPWISTWPLSKFHSLLERNLRTGNSWLHCMWHHQLPLLLKCRLNIVGRCHIATVYAHAKDYRLGRTQGIWATVTDGDPLKLDCYKQSNMKKFHLSSLATLPTPRILLWTTIKVQARLRLHKQRMAYEFTTIIAYEWTRWAMQTATYIFSLSNIPSGSLVAQRCYQWRTWWAIGVC